jgi:hypothetical protein
MPFRVRAKGPKKKSSFKPAPARLYLPRPRARFCGGLLGEALSNSRLGCTLPGFTFTAAGLAAEAVAPLDAALVVETLPGLPLPASSLRGTAGC